MNIFDMTDMVISNPVLYLGEKKVTLLKAFLDGYSACKYMDGKYSKDSKRLFPLDFSNIGDYISMRIGKYTTQSWSDLLIDFYGSEETAFDAFGAMYQEFREIRMKRGSRAALNYDNMRHNDCMRYGYKWVSKYERRPIYDRPLSVCIVEMTKNSGYMLLVETASDIIIDSVFLATVDEAEERVHTLFGYVKNWSQLPVRDNIQFNKSVHG